VEKTGESTDAKPSRILSGLEPEKTNQLLQILAKGIQMERDAQKVKSSSLDTKSSSDNWKEQRSKKARTSRCAGTKEKVRGSKRREGNEKAKLLANMKKSESGMSDPAKSIWNKSRLLPGGGGGGDSNRESKNPSSKLTQDNNSPRRAYTASFKGISHGGGEKADDAADSDSDSASGRDKSTRYRYPTATNCLLHLYIARERLLHACIYVHTTYLW